MEKTLFSRDYKVLLRLLREAREKVGVSQVVLAERLDETQSHISKCERGERRLDVIELRRWCLAIEVPFLAFLSQFENALHVSPRQSRKKS